MKKKMITLLAAAMLTMSAASSAMAAFAQGDLIRVIYDTKGTTEIATDLGSISTLTTLGANSVVGGGIDATTLAQFGGSAYSDLRVGYFGIQKANTGVNVANLWLAGDPNVAPKSGALKWSGAYTAFNNTLGNYAQSTGSTAVISDKSVGNTFFVNLDRSGLQVGNYGTYLPTNPAGGVLNLAALATIGYVDQAIYNWSGTATNAGAGGALGTKVLTLRTLANGSTVINPGAASTPIPPAFLLMGSGLLGMVGIRRKMAA